MAPRSAWKGYLKLSPVTCAVELTNVVTHAEKISFNVLSRKTGNRVERVYADAETGKPVHDEDEIRGYEMAATTRGASSAMPVGSAPAFPAQARTTSRGSSMRSKCRRRRSRAERGRPG